MKLVAFRIKHFRSIIDTDWCDLSTDNITGLIGQNESGKSSVLEALYSFYTGDLDEDYIRSDNIEPEVSCSFEVDPNALMNLFQEYTIPDKLKEKISDNNNRISLVCNWSGLTSSDRAIVLASQKLIDVFTAAASEDKQSPESALPISGESLSAVSAGEMTVPESTPEETATETENTKPPLTIETFTNVVFGEIPAFELFVDDDSLLPARIDLADIVANKKISGIKGAKNFLTIIGLEPADLSGADDRIIGGKIRTANKSLTKEFQSFWSQYIGKSNKIEIEFELKHHNESETALAGKPYLTFWVKDGDELLHPAQRSKGVRWFLSFFLQLKASALLHLDGRVLLIDEPGACLHAKAQEDVLKLFEDIKSQLQIIYTTHSPYLIEAETLYRLLAVQRANDDDNNSETKVFDIHKLGAASRDTLLPIYTLIGVNLQHQRVIKANGNVIIEEPSAFYYLQAFKILTDSKKEMNFMPSTGVTNVPLLVNLFLGWGLDFIVLTDDDDAGKRVRRKLKADIYGGSDADANDKLLGIKNCKGIEDVFSKTDFREHILGDKSLAYAEENSEYMSKSSESKVLVAIGFYNAVVNGEITMEKLAKTTQTNIRAIIKDIVDHL